MVKQGILQVLNISVSRIEVNLNLEGKNILISLRFNFGLQLPTSQKYKA